MSQMPQGSVPSICHSQPSIGGGAATAAGSGGAGVQEPLAAVAGPVSVPATPVSKIRAFDQKLISSRHEDSWTRSPNVTGTGAIHVKSFHCKLTDEALHYLDQQINEWLDAHPQYEVKFVTTAVGEWTGKMKEPNLIAMVWV